MNSIKLVLEKGRRPKSSYYLIAAYVTIILAVAYVIYYKQTAPAWMSFLSAGGRNSSADRTDALLTETMVLHEFGEYVDVTVLDGGTRGTHWRRYDAYSGAQLFRIDVNQNLAMKSLRFCSETERWFGIEMPSQTRLIAGRGRFIDWKEELKGQSATDVLEGCLVSPKHRLLVVYSGEGALWEIRYDDGDHIQQSPRHVIEEPFFFAALSPIGEQVALITNRHQVLIWDIPSARVASRFQLKDHDSSAVISWSLDSQRVITCGLVHTVAVWAVDSGNLLQEWSARCQSPKVAALSSTGAMAAVVDGPEIRVRNLDNGEEQVLIYEDGVISQLQFTHDDRTLLAADAKGNLIRWSLCDCRKIWKTQLNFDVSVSG